MNEPPNSSSGDIKVQKEFNIVNEQNADYSFHLQQPSFLTTSETNPSILGIPFTKILKEQAQIEDFREEGKNKREIIRNHLTYFNIGRIIATIGLLIFLFIYWGAFGCKCNRDIVITFVTVAPFAFLYFGYDIAKLSKITS